MNDVPGRQNESRSPDMLGVMRQAYSRAKGAARTIGALLPIPKVLGLDATQGLEADLLRARRALSVQQHESALGILRAAIERTQLESADRVVEMRCRAEFSVGQIECHLGRPDAALSAYRRTIEHYKARSEIPGIALCSMRALTAEAEIHRVRGHLTLAVSALDQLLSSHGTTTDPECVFHVARALFDKANVLDELGQTSEAGSLYRELVRCYSGVDHLPVTRLVVKALYNCALIAQSEQDTPGELACYIDLVARFVENQDNQIQELVVMALSGEAFALVRTQDYESALEAFGQLAERCRGHEGQRFDEEGAAARIWSAILQEALHRPGAHEQLERVWVDFREDRREQVVKAVAAARASLARG